jgi:DNA-binding HxlR family transcriptional regulator
MTMKTYGQYCPIAQAAEILNQRWTLLILRDVLYGARRFNEIRKFVPLMSPTLLSRRLREMEATGLIHRLKSETTGVIEYHPTAAAAELAPLIELLGAWGQRWVRNRLKEDELDASTLMARIRDMIDTSWFPAGRTVVAIVFADDPPPQKEAWRLDQWWLVVEGGKVELCLKDPGYEIDVFVTTDLRTLTRYFMGDFSFRDAARSGAIEVIGPKPLADGFERWMPRSHFGQVPRPPEPLGLYAVINGSPATIGEHTLRDLPMRSAVSHSSKYLDHKPAPTEHNREALK